MAKLADTEKLLLEVERVKELNFRLLDSLQATIAWLLNFGEKNNVSIPNLDALCFLVKDSMKIMSAISSDSYCELNLANRIVTRKNTNREGDVTLPEVTRRLCLVGRGVAIRLVKSGSFLSQALNSVLVK